MWIEAEVIDGNDARSGQVEGGVRAIDQVAFGMEMVDRAAAGESISNR